jgi:hypothetical protein
VHDPGGEHALLDRLGDRAAAADGVEGPDVVLVAVLDPDPLGQVDPSEVPYRAPSMSWVARALPANSTSM